MGQAAKQGRLRETGTIPSVLYCAWMTCCKHLQACILAVATRRRDSVVQQAHHHKTCKSTDDIDMRQAGHDSRHCWQDCHALTRASCLTAQDRASGSTPPNGTPQTMRSPTSPELNAASGQSVLDAAAEFEQAAIRKAKAVEAR